MDFPLNPSPPPSPTITPPLFFSLTFLPFHLLFTARSIIITRCLPFHSNSHSIVRSSSLRSLFSTLPFPSVPLSIYPFFSSLSRHLIWYLFGGSPFVFAFLYSQVSPLHVVFSSLPPHTKPINSFTSLAPVTLPLFFFASLRTCRRKTTLTPNLVAFYVLPHSSPQRPVVVALASFSPSFPYLPSPSAHLSPFLTATPPVTPTYAHLQPPIHIQSEHSAIS